MSEKCYCGVDPGITGGFAVVCGNKIRCKMAMPTLSFKTKKGETRREIDRAGVVTFLSTLPLHIHVAIEKQEAFRGQNITASCTICFNFGLLHMALTVAHTFITEVPANVWQAYFGIVSVKKSGGVSTKVQAAHIAQALFTDADFRKSERSRRFHDGIVDATLLAHYCQLLFQEDTQPVEIAR